MRWSFVLIAAALLSARPAAADDLAELTTSFTIGGKPIPPQAFADFGDAWMSDPRPIVTAIDARAAIDSNRYFGDITRRGDWLEQQLPGEPGLNGPPSIAYAFRGHTANGLLVVISIWSGGGTGEFTFLHLLDAVPANAVDADGSTYERLDLRQIATYVLGDRWLGDITISDNDIRVHGDREGAADIVVHARRP